jgi:hypothetical protein
MSTPVVEHAFAAPVLRQGDGLRMHILPLPAEVDADLRARGVLRVVCALNGVEVRRGVLSRAEGGRFLAVGQTVLRDIRARHGDWVEVVLRPDPDPSGIDLGDAFAAVLDDDPEAAARFFGMTPGRQRSLAYYATSAKRPETRLKRALELAEKLRTHTLYGDTRTPDDA